MAIKGKSKPKSRSSGARAPRQTPVAVKAPFFQRRLVQVALALVAGIALMVVFVWATNGVRRQNRSRDRSRNLASARTVITQWQGSVDAQVARIGSAQPGAAPVVFPSLSSTIDQMAKGSPPKDAGSVASTVQTDASAAADSLSGVKLVDMIRGHGVDVLHTTYLLNSQSRMVEALRVYARVGSLVEEATNADVATAKSLVADAQDLQTVAQQLFQEGYSDYQQALAYVGIFPQIQQPGIPGIPGAGS